jgi:phospholipase/carboxylesterase
LRDARSFGAIVVAPTATAALVLDGRRHRQLKPVRISIGAKPLEHRSAKLLLTGISDGGTFCYVTGLERISLSIAPVAATFHPLMAEMADAERLRACRSSRARGSTGCFQYR